MATVYKAYHARLDRFVAIKVMHSSYVQNDAFLSRFEREARIVARLEHPHIVPVYDFSEIDKAPYLVMKFIEGRTLKDILREEHLNHQQILTILTPIASALDYAHSQGVLHRDIKPSNIILDGRGVPYLTDFGLARLAHAGESTMSADVMLGTPHYISPEQASGSATLDARTDVYSLGIVLYELLTGRVPYSGDTPYAIVHNHIYTPVPRPSQINPAITPTIEAVLLKALAKSPTDRYSSAGELLNALRQALAEPEATSPDGELARPPEPALVRPPQPPSPPAPPRPNVSVERSPKDVGEDFGRRMGEFGERMGEIGERWGEMGAAGASRLPAGWSPGWRSVPGKPAVPPGSTVRSGGRGRNMC